MLAFTDLDGNRCRMSFGKIPMIVSKGRVRKITRVYVAKIGYEYQEVNLQTVNLEAEVRAVFTGSCFLLLPDIRRMAMDLRAYCEVLGHENVEAIFFCYESRN
jgi:hypothetical protein